MGLADILKTNKQVAVSGALKSREYNGKIYFSIRGPQIKLLGGNEQNTTPPQGEPPRDPRSDMDDEIPF